MSGWSEMNGRESGQAQAKKGGATQAQQPTEGKHTTSWGVAKKGLLLLLLLAATAPSRKGREGKGNGRVSAMPFSHGRQRGRVTLGWGEADREGLVTFRVRLERARRFLGLWVVFWGVCRLR